MHLTGCDQRKQLINWADKVQQFAKDQGDEKGAKEIALATQEFGSGRFTVAILGRTKSGKSTLCNAWLGRKDDTLAPVDDDPASSVVTKFAWSAAPSAIVNYRDGGKEPIDYDSVRNYVTEDGNPGNGKGVRFVEVRGDFAGLDHDVVLMDTPGSGSVRAHHDALLLEFLPEADAAVFLCSSRTFDEPVLELLRSWREHTGGAESKKLFFAINKADVLSDTQDLTDALSHNTRLLASVGINVDKLWVISAKKAFAGDPNSGVQPMLNSIGKFLGENKGNIMLANFVQRVACVLKRQDERLALEEGLASRSLRDLEQIQGQVRAEMKDLQRRRLGTIGKFRNRWAKAVSMYETELDDAKRQSVNKMRTLIDQAWTVAIGSLRSTLPVQLDRIVTDAIKHPTDNFATEAQRAVDDFQKEADIPFLDIAVNGEFRVKDSSNTRVVVKISDVAKVLVGGSIAASVGTASTAFVWTLAGIPWVGTLLGASAMSILTPIVVPIVGASALVAALGGWRVWASYRAATIARKEEMERECDAQIRDLFSTVISDRVSRLRAHGDLIIQEYETNLEARIGDMEGTIADAIERRQAGSGASAKHAAVRRDLDGLDDALRQLSSEAGAPAQLP